MSEKTTKADQDYAGREVEFKILRYDPDRDAAPHFQSFKLKPEHGMTVLDALMRIKETQDATLSYRKSCRMGICGSCAMMVNGFPKLTCQTQLSEYDLDKTIEVRPLANYPILRDLVPDLRDFLRAHEKIMPYVIHRDMEELQKGAGEFVQSPE